jgi:hypothetical protein
MSLFTTATPPRLPSAPQDYSELYMSGLLNVLYLYFQQVNAVQPINITQLNIDVARLPTETSLATLRFGDVYRDTTAGNVLKIKV